MRETTLSHASFQTENSEQSVSQNLQIRPDITGHTKVDEKAS